MRIFISHSLGDENLASKLKNILEEYHSISEAYIAIRTPNFELEISQKITNEIKRSDYLVAIITNSSLHSASVHQELGFAQGVETSKIPMVEESAKEGVLLEGIDKIYFTKNDFDKACKEVLDYIIKNGPKKPYSENEKNFVQKSAHFRHQVESGLIHFMSGLLVRLDLPSKHVFFSIDGREKAEKSISNFIQDKQKMYEKVIQLPLRNLFSMYDDFKLLRRDMEDAKRFPNSEFFPTEQDVLLKLQDRILEVNSSGFDLRETLIKDLGIRSLNYDDTFDEVIKQHKEFPALPQNLSLYVWDLQILSRAVIALDKSFLKIRKKFGDLAFKDTYDEDSA